MSIEKLAEFAKDGDKNLDNLDVNQGFLQSEKPERQWFNKLFGDITGKINEVISGVDDLVFLSGGVLNTTFLSVMTGVKDGTKVYVKSVEKSFIFTTTPTSPVNTGTVIQGVGGVWEMEIQSAYYASMFCPDSSIGNVNEPQQVNINAGYRYAASKGRPFIIDNPYFVKSVQHWAASTYPPISGELNASSYFAIRVQSNSVLAFQNGGKLTLQPSEDDYGAVLMVFDVENYVILDPVIIGDKDTHLVTTGEQQHCLHLAASKNGYIRNPKLSNSWGDGIYLGFMYWVKPLIDVYVPTNVVIDNAVIFDISRNGISLCGADRVTFNNTRIKKVDRTAPKAGIDIEPEEDTNFTIPMFIKEVVFNNVIVEDASTAFSSYIFGNRHVDVRFTGDLVSKECHLNLDVGHIKLGNQTWVDYKQTGHITVDNFIVENSATGDWYAGSHESPKNSVPVTIRNMEIRSANSKVYFGIPQSDYYTESTGLRIENIYFSNPNMQFILNYIDESSAAKPSINYYLGIPDHITVVYKDKGITFSGACYIGGYSEITSEYINSNQHINKVVITPRAVGGAGVVCNIYAYTSINNGRKLSYSLNPSLLGDATGDGILLRVDDALLLSCSTARASINITLLTDKMFSVESSYGSWIP